MRSGALVLALAAALPAPDAGAKVAFTGYADINFVARRSSELGGTPSVLADLGVSPRRTVTRGFEAEAVGIFAATKLAEPLSFLMDVTFRRIGFDAEETRLQYAFLEYAPSDDWTGRVGKITLPFGYYNERRFYPFQRYTATPPAFVNGVLGLPISDLGGSVSKRFSADAFQAELAVFVVNGYGSIPTSTASFRTPTSLGLVLTSNLTRQNNNEQMAYGARLALSEIAGRDLGAGLSYYRGEWDPGGRKPFQMYNAYALAGVGRLKVLAEALRMEVDDDPGFEQSVGARDWHTDGGFVEASLAAGRVFDRRLVHFFLGEYYETRGRGGGPRERLAAYALGTAVEVNPSLVIKLQYRHLDYVLPLFGRGDARVDQDDVRLAAAITF